MIYVTVERIVRQRPDVVWSFLTDTTSLTSWIEGAVEATVTSDVKSGVGLEIAILRRDGARTTRATCEVTAWREPALLAVETRLPDRTLLDRATLAPHADGTALGVYAEILFGSKIDELLSRPGNFLRASPTDPELQGSYERSVESLAKRIEALSAVPYR